MRSFFPVSLLFLLLFTGCATVRKQDLSIIKNTTVTPEIIGSPFIGQFEKALFKTSLDIGKNHLTGYTLIKKVSDSSFRLVFANQIGMTWFDLELMNGKLIKHSVFGPLDKKNLLGIFKQDFNALIHTSDAKPCPTVYSVNASENYALIGGSNPIVRYRIDYEKRKSGVAHKIIIVNPAIKLKMTLNMMGQ
ncbi:MAG: hypothetical protein M0Q38_09695 [Bacteroidales bacterium]|jgi:hypothetical protein|nr:hypothetical protein [Bacteroidales bacterium]